MSGKLTTVTGRKPGEPAVQWLGAQTGRLAAPLGLAVVPRQVQKAAALEAAEDAVLKAGAHVHRHRAGGITCLNQDPVCEAALVDRNASIREDEDR